MQSLDSEHNCAVCLVSIGAGAKERRWTVDLACAMDEAGPGKTIDDLPPEVQLLVIEEMKPADRWRWRSTSRGNFAAVEEHYRTQPDDRLQDRVAFLMEVAADLSEVPGEGASQAFYRILHAVDDAGISQNALEREHLKRYITDIATETHLPSLFGHFPDQRPTDVIRAIVVGALRAQNWGLAIFATRYDHWADGWGWGWDEHAMMRYAWRRIVWPHPSPDYPENVNEALASAEATVPDTDDSDSDDEWE